MLSADEQPLRTRAHGYLTAAFGRHARNVYRANHSWLDANTDSVAWLGLSIGAHPVRPEFVDDLTRLNDCQVYLVERAHVLIG